MIWSAETAKARRSITRLTLQVRNRMAKRLSTPIFSETDLLSWIRPGLLPLRSAQIGIAAIWMPLARGTPVRAPLCRKRKENMARITLLLPGHLTANSLTGCALILANATQDRYFLIQNSNVLKWLCCLSLPSMKKASICSTFVHRQRNCIRSVRTRADPCMSGQLGLKNTCSVSWPNLRKKVWIGFSPQAWRHWWRDSTQTINWTELNLKFRSFPKIPNSSDGVLGFWGFGVRD